MQKMKKIFLTLAATCFTTFTLADVTPVDVNGDSFATVFLDAQNGLYWTTGKPFAPETKIKGLNYANATPFVEAMTY